MPEQTIFHNYFKCFTLLKQFSEVNTSFVSFLARPKLFFAGEKIWGWNIYF